jgi:hypothetical protein
MATQTKRKPPSSGRRKKKQNPWTRGKQRINRHLNNHPGQALGVMIVLGIVSTLCLVLGLVAENLLYFLATGLSALATVAAARTAHLAKQRQEASTRIPKPPKPPRQPTPTPPNTPTPPPAGGQEVPPPKMQCTNTRKPVGPNAPPEKACRCSRRGHVVTREGFDRFGGPYGRPLAPSKKPTAADGGHDHG